MTSRRCSHCKQPESEHVKFHKTGSWCLTCQAEGLRERRSANMAEGLCYCGKPSASPASLCTHHLEYARQQFHKARLDIDWLEKKRERSRQETYRLKIEAFMAYGGCVCACDGCSETHIEFLSIDHINGSSRRGSRLGRKNGERKGRGPHKPHRSGQALYRWLKTNGYPAGFRVLCMNCNFARGHAGYCPHEREHAKAPVLSAVS